MNPPRAASGNRRVAALASFLAWISLILVTMARPSVAMVSFKFTQALRVGSGLQDLAVLSGDPVTVLVVGDTGLSLLAEHRGNLFVQDQLGDARYLKTVSAGEFRSTQRYLAYAGRDASHLFIAPIGSDASVGGPVRVELPAMPRRLQFAAQGGDGNVALFVLHDKGLTVVRPDGSGDYQTSEVAAPAFATDLQVADLDLDGWQDLIVADPDDRLTFFAGEAGGVFRSEGTVRTISKPVRLAVMDADRDGRPDVLVLGERGLELHIQSDGGGFRRAEMVWSAPHLSDMAIADIDADGGPDLVITDRSRGSVTFLIADGDGSFSHGDSYVVGRGPTKVAVADVDGDAHLDVLTLNSLDGTIALLPGLASGAFDGTRAVPVDSEDLGGIAAEDFNQDANLDFVVTSESGGNIHVFLGRGDGGFTPVAPRAVGRQPRGLVAGNLDGNALPDLAVANFGTDEVAVLSGDGRGGFAAPILVPVGLGPIAIAAGDFNSEPGLDLAVANMLSDSVSILYGDGHGGFADTENFPVVSRPSFLLVGDLNGDHHADLAVGGRNRDEVAVLHGDGTRLGEPEITTLAASASPTVATDFDGDGEVDLVAIDELGDAIRVLPGLGAGAFEPPIELQVGSTPTALASGDLDGDGRPDLVLVHRAARLVSILLNRSDSPKPPP